MYWTILSISNDILEFVYLLIRSQWAWPLKDTKIELQFEKQSWIQIFLKYEYTFGRLQVTTNSIVQQNLIVFVHYCWTDLVVFQTTSSFRKLNLKKGDNLSQVSHSGYCSLKTAIGYLTMLPNRGSCDNRVNSALGTGHTWLEALEMRLVWLS